MSITLRQFIAMQSSSPPGTTIRECLNNPTSGSSINLKSNLQGKINLKSILQGKIIKKNTLKGQIKINSHL